MVNLMLTDVNSSTQQIDFTMPVGTETTTKDGISFIKKNYNAEPKIYFCGSAKDLKTCLKKEITGDVGWWGKVTVMIYAPGWNTDIGARDSIGETAESAITITSRGDHGVFNVGVCNDSDSEGLIETSPDSGVFYGRLKLSASDHDMNNDGIVDTKLGGTSCKNSPFDEYAKIETGRDGAVTVNWEYNPEDNKTVSKTFTYGWSVASISFLEDEYPLDGKTRVQFKLKEKDLGDMPKNKIDLNKIYLSIGGIKEGKDKGHRELFNNVEKEIPFFINSINVYKANSSTHNSVPIVSNPIFLSELFKNFRTRYTHIAKIDNEYKLIKKPISINSEISKFNKSSILLNQSYPMELAEFNGFCSKYENSGLNDYAIKLYENAIELYPNYFEFHLYIAELLLKTNVVSAIDHLKKSKQLINKFEQKLEDRDEILNEIEELIKTASNKS